MVAKNIESQEIELKELIAAASNRERQARSRAFLYIIIPFVVGGLWLAFSMYQLRQFETRAALLNQQRNDVSQELERKNKELKEAKDALLAINPMLEKYGVLKEKLTAENINSTLVKQSLEANNEIQNILSAGGNERRRAVTILYFPKEDRSIVEAALKEFGFKVNTGIAGNKQETNAIFAGPKVNPEDVKLVAYVLIRAGVEIKGIYRTTSTEPIYSLDRPSVVQVLGNTDIVNKSPLTVEQIRNQKEFYPISQ